MQEFIGDEQGHVKGIRTVQINWVQVKCLLTFNNSSVTSLRNYIYFRGIAGVALACQISFLFDAAHEYQM